MTYETHNVRLAMKDYISMLSGFYGYKTAYAFKKRYPQIVNKFQEIVDDTEITDKVKLIRLQSCFRISRDACFYK